MVHFWRKISGCARECRSICISDHQRHDSRRDNLLRERHWVPDTETIVLKSKGESASLTAADFVSAESPVTWREGVPSCHYPPWYYTTWRLFYRQRYTCTSHRGDGYPSEALLSLQSTKHYMLRNARGVEHFSASIICLYLFRHTDLITIFVRWHSSVSFVELRSESVLPLYLLLAYLHSHVVVLTWTSSCLHYKVRNKATVLRKHKQL